MKSTLSTPITFLILERSGYEALALHPLDATLKVTDLLCQPPLWPRSVTSWWHHRSPRGKAQKKKKKKIIIINSTHLFLSPPVPGVEAPRQIEVVRAAEQLELFGGFNVLLGLLLRLARHLPVLYLGPREDQHVTPTTRHLQSRMDTRV